MDEQELYEDGFSDKEKQIKILDNKGLGLREIIEKVGLPKDRVVEVLKSKNRKNNLNE